MPRFRKNLLITGGSNGIGAAISRLAACNGYDIALTYNSDKTAASAVETAVFAAGARCKIYQCDVADPDQITKLFNDFDNDFSKLHALVNNAGIVDVAARVDEISHARLRRIFDINVIGAFLVAGQAARRMSTEFGGNGGEPDRADRMSKYVPMKRKGTAQEVAEAALWLLSDKASYVTGTTLDVSGGR